MKLRIIGTLLYFGGPVGGLTVAYFMWLFGYTTYLPHIIIGGLLISAWVAIVAITLTEIKK